MAPRSWWRRSPNIDDPDRGSEKGKQFLHTSEVAAFVAHPEEHILWRRLLAVAVPLLVAMRKEAGGARLVAEHSVSIAFA